MKFQFLILIIIFSSCKNSSNKIKTLPADTTKTVVKAEPVWPEVLPDDGQEGQRKGAVFIFKNRGFEMFSGGASMGKQYAEVINKFNRLKIPGLKIYNLIIPNAFEFEVTENISTRSSLLKKRSMKFLQRKILRSLRSILLMRSENIVRNIFISILIITGPVSALIMLTGAFVPRPASLL